MNKNIQEVIFNELNSRYSRLFYKIILDFFQDIDDAKDVYQDFCIHLYSNIQKHYSEKPDLFDSKSWIVSIVKNFCISEIRKRNGKRRIKTQQVQDNNVLLAMLKDDFGETLELEKQAEAYQVMNEVLSFLDRRDILILKMKYYYGKSSAYISQKMNEAHVDVYIGRLKKKIKKECGVENFNELVTKFNLSL